jgi:hypothetical protein
MINDQHGNLYNTGKFPGYWKKNILAISPLHPLVPMDWADFNVYKTLLFLK